MNFLRKIIGASAVDEVALIPQGKLFLARSPLLPKGALECLYNDAYITIKQTTTPYLYQLAAIRAYEEGEVSPEALDEADGDDDSEGAALDSRNADEWVFFLAPELKVRICTKHDGTRVIAWKDMNGDLGDLFEFVVDEEVKYNELDHFMAALYRCLYELKYQKSSAGVEAEQLEEFVYNPKLERDEDQLPLHGLKTLLNIQYEFRDTRHPEKDDEEDEEEDEEEEDEDDQDQFSDAQAVPSHLFSKGLKVQGEEIFKCSAELRVFDPTSDSFLLLARNLTFKVMNVTDKGYCVVSTTEKYAFCIPLTQEMNPAFNFEYKVFIFNHYVVEIKRSGEASGESTAYSLMLKFDSFEELEKFQNVFFKAMYSAMTDLSYNKNESDSMSYIEDAFGRVEIADSSEVDSDDYVDAQDELDGEEALSKIIQTNVKTKHSRPNGLFVASDSEDEYDDDIDIKQEKKFLSSKYKNSQLAIGQANDRSYVTRGDSLGVYKRDDEGLGFLTTISGLKDLSGKKILAKRTLLHQRDNALLLTKDDPTDTKIYKVDLTKGEVVEAWEADDKEKLESFAPISKFAGLTNEQTLNGISANALFRIDPRLSGKKIVKDKTFKGYKTKNNGFATMTTTDQGYIAVGLSDGGIRLYDRLGLNAKSALPALGAGFVGIDVSKDGRWLLATCKTYLLLIDLKIGKDQKNAGSLGFEKYFDADKKPVPKRLALRPEHVSQLALASNSKEINFTKAVFNTLLTSKETTIVASTGPYVILWSLTKIAKNWKQSATYNILRYSQDAVADSFMFDSQNDIVTVLKDDVSLLNKNEFKRVSNSSIVNNYKRS